MNTASRFSFVARLILIFSLGFGVMRAAVAEGTPLTRADIGRVEAVLGKNLKGKPVVQSGTKQQVDGGWRITCNASVGSGGTFKFVLMTETSMTLGYIESQAPVADAAPTSTKGAKK